MEQQLSPTGEELCTEYDCPIVELTNHLVIVNPSIVIGPVSIVHLCSNTCKMIDTFPVRLYEREQVLDQTDKSKAVFKHDLNNRLYCFNIYCTGNYFH